MTEEKKPTYRVVAVNCSTKERRFLAEGKTEKNAQAIADMAVIRRGIDEELFFIEMENSPCQP